MYARAHRVCISVPARNRIPGQRYLRREFARTGTRPARVHGGGRGWGHERARYRQEERLLQHSAARPPNVTAVVVRTSRPEKRITRDSYNRRCVYTARTATRDMRNVSWNDRRREDDPWCDRESIGIYMYTAYIHRVYTAYIHRMYTVCTPHIYTVCAPRIYICTPYVYTVRARGVPAIILYLYYSRPDRVRTQNARRRPYTPRLFGKLTTLQRSATARVYTVQVPSTYGSRGTIFYSFFQLLAFDFIVQDVSRAFAPFSRSITFSLIIGDFAT